MYKSGPAIQSRGFSSEPTAQRLDMSRPSAKSIYMQRKEYSETLNRRADTFQYRVQHLFTCELSGRKESSIDDCVEKLKNLEGRGKIWGQDMILQVQNGCLQLCDFETKEVLDSRPLGSISETKAVLDSCKYDSLLTVTVQDHSRRAPNVFLFQCEESGAEEVNGDLNRAIQRVEPEFPTSEPPFDIRTNLENIIGQGHPGSFRRPHVPPPEFPPPPPQHNSYPSHDSRSPVFPRREEEYNRLDMQEQPNRNQPSPPPAPPSSLFSDNELSVEIFNHVVADIEIFMDKVGSALPQEDTNSKKKKKKKAQTEIIYGVNFPSVEEYVACLQKFKCAFNLLAKLGGHLTNPDAPQFVHILFSSLGFLVLQYPRNVPPSVVSPLLTEPALKLLGQVVTPEEDKLWSSLGDSWNIPRSNWPNANQIPPYFPVFYDGWQPPAPRSPQSSPSSRLLLRNNSQRFSGRNASRPPSFQDNRPVGAPSMHSGEPSLYMRVIYDFTARNRQELSVMKGEVVQVIEKSRQWWIVRNNYEAEGHVPPNILEPMSKEPPRMTGPPNLDMRSSPEEVTAWLQYKGFSKTTMRNLGVMNGELLLGLKRDEMRALCPEEGARVFFHLQAVKSSMALASESEYNNYGSRYT